MVFQGWGDPQLLNLGCCAGKEKVDNHGGRAMDRRRVRLTFFANLTPTTCK
jgi:hypothetical protein